MSQIWVEIMSIYYTYSVNVFYWIVVTVTTCIYLEPNITCYPTTCVPVTNNNQTIRGPLIITTTTVSPTGGSGFSPFPRQGKRVKRSKQIKTDTLILDDTDNIT